MSGVNQDWKPSKTDKIDEREFDFSEITAHLWRKKLLLFVILILSFLIALFYVQNLQPLYSAEAKLILKLEEKNIAGLENFLPDVVNEDSEINSQIEVITSRSLIGRVVDKLGLYNDPEFVGDLRRPSLWGKLIEFVTTKLKIANQSRIQSSERFRKSAIDQLIRNLKITPVKNSRVFIISLLSQSPQKSMLVVNTFSDEIVKDQILTKVDSTADAADWLNEKVLELGGALVDAESKAASFRSKTDRAVTREDLAQSNLNLKNARGRLDSFVAKFDGPVYEETPIADIDKNKITFLKRDIQELEKIVEQQTRDILKIRQLDREAISAAEIYKHFATRLNEIEVQRGLQESDIRIISYAVTREVPSWPNKRNIIFLICAFSILSSSILIVANKFFDKSFYDPVILEQVFGIPVVGTIVRGPTASRKGLFASMIKRPTSPMMDSIRDLRTSLSMQNSGSFHASENLGTAITVTSSVPAEGKTTISVLLGVSFTQLYSKVLVIECDLRRSSFKSYFGIQSKLGLVDALDQDIDWKRTVWNEPRTGVDFIFGGSARGRNPADVFASPDFSNLIRRARADYDLVLLDAPPALPVPDARLIAAQGDCTLYVVHSGSTARSTVKAGLRLFLNDNREHKVDGLVLSQVKLGQSYGYQGYEQYS